MSNETQRTPSTYPPELKAACEQEGAVDMKIQLATGLTMRFHSAMVSCAEWVHLIQVSEVNGKEIGQSLPNGVKVRVKAIAWIADVQSYQSENE